MALSLLKRIKNPLLIIFMVFVIVLPAILPFSTGRMLDTDDGTIHLYRVIALDHAIETTGLLYPRYAPGLVFGYGSPLFNYFPPVPYYVPYGLNQLGLTYIDSWLATMMIYTYLAGLGAFLLGRCWRGTLSGVITSIAYVYAPYMLFDAITRGTLIEYAGLAGLPFVLWGLTKLGWQPTRANFVLALVMFTLFIPLHNVITLHGAILIAFYSLLLVTQSHQPIGVFWRLCLVGVLGVGLTTFFWLPALTETDAVKINAITASLSNIDVTQYLRPVNEILALPKPADLTYLQAPIPITLSWVSLLLLMGGYCVALVRQSPLRPILLFSLVTTLFLIFMNTSASSIIWNTIPLLDYTQFAWRTLGIASLVIALGAGVGGVEIMTLIPTQRLKIAVLTVFIALLVLYSTSWLYSRYIDVSATAITDVHDYERRTNELSLSSYSEYLPSTNETPPDRERLKPRYADRDVIARSLHPAIRQAQWAGTSATMIVNLAESQTLEFDWLYTAGWSATLDDSPLVVYPSAGVGLVTVDLPAGQHRLTIILADTPRQSTANQISLLMVFLVCIIIWRIPSLAFDVPHGADNIEDHNQRQRIAPGTIMLTVLITMIGIISFKQLYIDNNQTLWRAERFANGIPQGLETPLNADFSNGIRILGVSMKKAPEIGEIGEIDLFAQLSGAPIGEDYSSQVVLENSDGIVVAEGGSFMPGQIATSNWIADTYTRDQISLVIAPDTPPGRYTLYASYYDPLTQTISSLLNEAGNPVASRVEIGKVELTRRDAMTNDHEDSTPWHIFAPDGLALMEAISLPDAVGVGDEIIVTGLWQLLSNTDANYGLEFAWQGADGNAVTSGIHPVIRDYPTSDWVAGDLWRGWYRLTIPASLPAGVATLTLQVVDPAGDGVIGDLLPLTDVTINTPIRVFEVPELSTPWGEVWGNGIELLGYDLSVTTNDTTSDSVTMVTLYWRTQRLINDNLHLFVQVLNDEERLLAQDTGIPVNWTRPTTSWVDGEIITTTHTLPVSLEDNELRIGWYNPRDNQRILLDDGQDYLIITDHNAGNPEP